MQRVGDPRIDHHDDRTVTSETPIFAQRVATAPGTGGGDGHEKLPEGEPYLECFSGWYLDRLEERDGARRIAHRRLVHAWDTFLPINSELSLEWMYRAAGSTSVPPIYDCYVLNVGE